jgi:hypothetical protein
MLKATSRAFVVNPALLGAVRRSGSARDRFSSAFLVATATRLIRDVALLGERARAVDQRLATFTMDTEVGFESHAAYRAFTEELAGAVTRIAAKYDTAAPKSRRFRVVLGSHPLVTKRDTDAAAETAAYRRTRKAKPRRNNARRP